MRKKGLFVLAMGVILTVLAVGVQAEVIEDSIVIKGYASNEFAVKGIIEKQITDLIRKIQEFQTRFQEQGLTNQVLTIGVAGSADRVGKSANNDRLAQNRAEQVAAILSNRFPRAQVQFWSEGDKANIKQVRVEYHLTAALPPPPVKPIIKEIRMETQKIIVKEPAPLNDLRLPITGVLVFALLLTLFILRHRRKKDQVEVFPKDLDKIKQLASSQSGKKEYLCPFCLESGAGEKLIQRKNIYRHVIKRCTKSPHYQNKKITKPRIEKLQLQEGSVSFVLLVMIIGLMVLGSLSGCGSWKHIMPEKQINTVPRMPQESYSVLWVNYHRLLFNSEGPGRHDVYTEEDKALPGIAVVKPGQRPRLMVIVTDPTIDFSTTKAVVSSRSGRHFYSVDGNKAYSHNGYLVPKLNWKEIRPLSESGIEIWENIRKGSSRDEQVEEIILQLARYFDENKVEFPGLFSKVMSKILRVSSDDIMIGIATDFSELFAIAGITKVWSAFAEIVQKADLSLPYYDTAPMDRFQAAHMQERMEEKIENLVEKSRQMEEEWRQEIYEYEVLKKQRQIAMERYLRLLEEVEKKGVIIQQQEAK
jgi:hypothetical protein